MNAHQRIGFLVAIACCMTHIHAMQRIARALYHSSSTGSSARTVRSKAAEHRKKLEQLNNARNALFASNLARLQSITPVLFAYSTKNNHYSCSQALNTCTHVEAPEAIKQVIAKHPIDGESKVQLCHKISDTCRGSRSRLTSSTRFITHNTQAFDQSVTAIANALERKVLIINASDYDFSNDNDGMRDFFDTYSRTFVDTVRSKPTQPLIIIVHLKDSQSPTHHLRKMIQLYAEYSSAFVESCLDRIQIIETAPHSLKTEEEKKAAAQDPWYIEWTKEVVLDK